MKKTIILTSLFLLSLAAVAQGVYSPAKKGAVLVYERIEADRYDRKQTFIGTIFRHTIKDVSDNGGNVSVTYLDETVEQRRKKEKSVMKEEAVSRQEGDVFYFDLRDITYRERQQLAESNAAGVEAGGSRPAGGMSGFRPTGVKIVDFGKDVYQSGEIGIPLNAQPGDVLPETTLYLERKAIVTTKCNVRTYGWKVEAVDEQVTVPAGTFNCIRLSCLVTYHFQGIARLANLGKVIPSPHTFWFAKGIGLVKMESELSEESSGQDKGIELIEVKNL